MVQEIASEVDKKLERPDDSIPGPVHGFPSQDYAQGAAGEHQIGKSESLKSYLSKFNKQSMEVEKIFDDAVLAGLRPRTRFWCSVHEAGPRTYHELLNRVEKYISAEEATSDQEEARCDPDLSNTVKKKRPDRNPQPKRRKDKREIILRLNHRF